MQQFVVSARKYRPLSWDEVVGQDHIVTTLKNAILQDHLAQSFLFCGPRGVGKTTCARILAKTINCENLSAEGTACDNCESCKSFAGNASFNIHEIDAASNNSVDDIRNLVDQVRYAPQSGKYKVYIIDEVHMLSAAAFNAFLKTLEEPPPYVKFILATTEKYKIIPTILSRCQIFDFNRITVKDMIFQLKKICSSEGIQADDEAFHLIAQKADGAMRDALSIFDRITTFTGKAITGKDVIENLNILDYDYYFKMTDMLLQQDAANILLLFNEITSKGFDGDTFLIGFAEHMRNLLVCHNPATIALLETSDAVAARYKQQANAVSPSFALSALNLLNQSDMQYRVAKNKHLHVELALLRLCYMSNAIQTPGIGTAPQKKTADLNRTVTEAPAVPRHQAPPADIQAPAVTKLTMEKYAAPEKETIKDDAEQKVELKIPVINLRSGTGKKEISKEESAAPEPVRESKPVQPEIFFMAWKQYADLIRQSKQHMAILMDHSLVHIGEENDIEIQVDSQMEVSLFRESAQELRSFLEEAMDNSGFELRFSVVEGEMTVRRPYTIMEKYRKMEEVNPDIRGLSEVLGMELDI
jgi:DNA polymerase-3 subunit gamma/tau